MTWTTATSGGSVTGMRRRAVVPAAALVFGLMPASPATTAEASPSNDDYADAEPIGSLPFADALDVADATSEPLETTPTCAANPSVPFPSSLGPVVGADLSSVWYRIEPASDSQITIDATGSDFTVFVGVYDGHDLATQQEVACARTDWHGTVTVNVDAGASYAIQLSRFSAQEGSALSVTVEETAIPGVAEILPFEVAAEDGTPLRGHVYLPEGDGPFAPVLEYSPYWNTAYGPSEAFTQTSGGRVTMAAWLGPLMDAGFAVALVNTRGTGESGGCMQWGGPVDWSDAATVVEALAAAEWSTGKVGMYGVSYPGWSQFWAIASGAAPSLKAVVPVSPITDLWTHQTDYGAVREVRESRYPVFAARMLTGIDSLRGSNQTGAPFVPDRQPEQGACPRFAEEVEHSPPVWNGDRTPYFRQRDLGPLIDGTKVAVFATLGLQTFQGDGGQDFEGHSYQLDGVWDLLGPKRRFMLGQWPHGFPTRPEFHRMAVAWLDQHLRDGAHGGSGSVRSGIVEYQDDTGVWHTARQWPPRADDATLWLSGDDLVTDQAEAASSRSFLSSDQVPCAGVCLRPAAGRLPGCTGDHLVYVSEPLRQEVVIAGNYTVDLTIESDLPDGTLASFLYHTDADDPCSAPQLTESGQAIGDLRHVLAEEGADFPVDTPTDVTLTSKPLASRIPAGHRLVLTVGSAGWDTVADPYRPTLIVTTGPGTVSALTLPIVQGALDHRLTEPRKESAASSRLHLTTSPNG